MPNKILTTPQLDSIIDNLSQEVQRDIERLFARIKASPSSRTSGRDPFVGIPCGGIESFPVGRQNKNNHLVGFRFDSTVHADYSVYCFFDFCKDGDLGPFGGQLQSFLQSKKKPMSFADSVLEQFVENSIDKDSDIVPSKDQLPAEYVGWLEPKEYQFAEGRDELGLLVEETKRWCKSVGPFFGDESAGAAIHKVLSKFYFAELNEFSKVSDLLPNLADHGAFFCADVYAGTKLLCRSKSGLKKRFPNFRRKDHQCFRSRNLTPDCFFMPSLITTDPILNGRTLREAAKPEMPI